MWQYLGGNALLFRLVKPSETTLVLLRNVDYDYDRIGLRGIISSLAVSGDDRVLAAGSYGHGVGIYDMRAEYTCSDMWDAGAGVTSMKWSRCGSYLWVGGRKSDIISCWDVRYQKCEVGRYF